MAGGSEFVFGALGGVGEIGMNLAVYGFGPPRDRQWLVVDCGVTFAGPDLPGIDLIYPDVAFLAGLGALSNAQKVGGKAFDTLVEQGMSFRKQTTDRTETLIDNVQDAIRDMSDEAEKRATERFSDGQIRIRAWTSPDKPEFCRQVRKPPC